MSYSEVQSLQYKQNFMDVYGSLQQFIDKMFRDLRPLERALQKDVGDFTVEEALEALRVFNAASEGSLRTKLCILRTYTRWYIGDGHNGGSITGINAYETINTEQLRQCINLIVAQKSYITQTKLRKWLNIVRNPSDKFILLALYEGIKGTGCTDLLSVKLKDFYTKDSINYVRVTSGKEFSVSEELLSYAIASTQADEYIRTDARTTKKFILLNQEYIIKQGIETENDTFERRLEWWTKRLILLKLALGASQECKPTNLFYSGLTERIVEYADKHGISIREALNQGGEELQAIYYRYDVQDWEKYRLVSALKRHISEEDIDRV